MEKTYFEFKITFLHIVVFLVAIVAIGLFLFYMGFQAGQRRSDPRTALANEQEPAAAAEELSVVDQPPVLPAAAPPAASQSIPEEMKLHQEQAAKPAPAQAPLSARPKAPETIYTIQVGAFADFANAQKCSLRFTNLGYPTAIITDNQKKLHTVQVGRFASVATAQEEKAKLEKQEKAKFQIKTSR